MLSMIRGQFYPDDEKKFWQERTLLLKAATYPAQWLDSRGVRLTQDRYSEILLGIIQTIKRHGNTANIRRFSAYLLHAIQTHMAHHGEEYYDEGKRTRQALEDVMHGLKKKSSAPKTDETVPVLAEVHRTLKTKAGRKPKSAKAPPTQGDLFG